MLKNLRILVLIAVLLSCGLQGVSYTSHSESTGLLFSLSEAYVAYSTLGLNNLSCIIVQPNGHFHLERREQRFPANSATLSVFESELTEEQLQQVQGILDDDSIRKLPKYVQPALPLSIPSYYIVAVTIAKQPKNQEVGYFTWQAGTGQAGKSPESTPDEIRKGWQQSEIALRPLIIWFHSLNLSNLKPLKVESNMCSNSQH